MAAVHSFDHTHRERLRAEAERCRGRATSLEDLARFWPLADWARRRWLEEAEEVEGKLAKLGVA